MKLGKCQREDDKSFWAIIYSDSGKVQPLVGTIKDWAHWVMAGEFDRLPLDGEAMRLDDIELLAPVEEASSVYVVGANYTRHLKEMDIEPAERPHVFLKSGRALVGPSDAIELSDVARQLDHEVELIAVVGSSLVEGQAPASCILGYMVGNEVSGRDLQPGTPGIGMDLFAAKSLFRTNPVGPWIVTVDEVGIGKPDLRMTLTVNGVIYQDGRSSEMNWPPGELIGWINKICRVAPGDIVFTGTPEGVGWKVGRFLQDGDVVETEIENIGKLSNRVLATGN